MGTLKTEKKIAASVLETIKQGGNATLSDVLEDIDAYVEELPLPSASYSRKVSRRVLRLIMNTVKVSL